MREIILNKKAVDQIDEWFKINPKIVKTIWELIKEIQRSPFEGKGKPEPLKYQYAGYWSRRIDHEHRLIYKITGQGEIMIVSCKGHYVQ